MKTKCQIPLIVQLFTLAHCQGKNDVQLSYHSHPVNDLGYHIHVLIRGTVTIYAKNKDRGHLVMPLARCNLEAPVPYCARRTGAFRACPS